MYTTPLGVHLPAAYRQLLEVAPEDAVLYKLGGGRRERERQRERETDRQTDGQRELYNWSCFLP